MSLEINAQYTKFVQFAEEQMQANNDEAIARDGGGPLDGRTIVAAEHDRVKSAFKWFRGGDDQRANNHARDLFRQAIIRMFGGSENNIPQNVKDAMQLHNFNNGGHPLTARRIMFVKAEVDRIIDDARAFNNKLAGDVMRGSLEELPESMQGSLNEIVNKLRTTYGAERVPQNAKITDIINPANIHANLNKLATAATAQGRKLSSQEVVGAIITHANTYLATTVAGARILDLVKAREPNVLMDNEAIGKEYNTAHPGLIDDLLNCKNEAEVATVFQNHEADMARFADVKARVSAAQSAIDTALVESGIQDAKVLKDVRDAILARVKNELSQPGESRGFLNFIDAVKADTIELAQTLNGIANIRTNASSISSTTISAFSGMGKAYVMNNLQISSTKDKLTFLYNDVTAKAKGGDNIEKIANLNKANDIITKFAMNKVEVLKDIDAGGFEPVECARYKRLALNDCAWKDTDMASVAKGIANNDSLKKAALLFAKAIKGDALESLDDLELRDVVLTFSKVLFKTFQDNYPEHFEKWSDMEHFETRQHLFDMVVHLLGKDQPDILDSLARLVVSDRFKTLSDNISTGLNNSFTLVNDYNDLKHHIEGGMNGPLALANPNLQYDEKKFQESIINNKVYNVASMVVGNIETVFAPVDKTVIADRHATAVVKGREIVAKYAGEVAQETLPVLQNLVRGLDWSAKKAADSENLVKEWVEDMKVWRDIVPGSTDADGVEKLLKRRLNSYLPEALDKQDNFTNDIYTTFLADLERDSVYTINGKKVRGATLQQKLDKFKNAFKDPAKLKIVSAVVNQQLWADYTSISNKMPLYRANQPDEPIDNVPNIDKFVSRDAMKTGMSLLGTGQLAFSLEISPDENTVTLHSNSTYPISGDFAMGPNVTIGKCKVTQELVIDLSGPEPAIRDYKVGQAIG